RHDNGVLNRTKVFESFRRELFSNTDIVFVNGAEHENKQRHYNYYYPRAVYELSGNEYAENNEGSDRAYRINDNGFFTVRTVCDLVGDKSRAALIRSLEFGVRQRLSIYSTLSVVDVLPTPFITVSLRRLRALFEPVSNHSRLRKSEGEKNSNSIKRNEPAGVAAERDNKNAGENCQHQDSI